LGQRNEKVELRRRCLPAAIQTFKNIAGFKTLSSAALYTHLDDVHVISISVYENQKVKIYVPQSWKTFIDDMKFGFQFYGHH